MTSESINDTLRSHYSIQNAKPDRPHPPKIIKIVKDHRGQVKSEGRVATDLPSSEIPLTTLADMGAIDSLRHDIHALIERPLKHHTIYRSLGIEPPKGILLFGPPGCGKTCLVGAIAGELKIPLIKITGPEIVCSMSGESESKLRDLFQMARTNSPCILFIDEVDAITPKRETVQKEMERRIVAQLLSCIDEIDSPMIVIGATNRPESIDPALRRAGRFDREICVGIPDVEGRSMILQVVCSKLKIDSNVSFFELASRTPGFVGADLRSLAREAASVAIDRILKVSNIIGSAEFEETLNMTTITQQDFDHAIGCVQPSAKREGFVVIPNVSWSDVGALASVREELLLSVVEPIKNPSLFKHFGITVASGILLWGPPGCGKTLLAKAVASETHSNFISVKGPELLNKYVGESERAIRQVFERAKASSPCVVFFDELDSLCPRRSGDSESSSARVVNQLLTEFDGLEDRKSVYILAATNRPDMIDPAMLRPGRLDKLLFVGLPDAMDRLDILMTITKNIPLDGLVDLPRIATDVKCDGMSGADLKALTREAALLAIKDILREPSLKCSSSVVTMAHFHAALENARPSVSRIEAESYESLRYLLSNK